MPIIRFGKASRKRTDRPWTTAESVLFTALLNAGYLFRCNVNVRQHLVDFLFPAIKLVIEIDGDIHNRPSKKLLDKRKQEQLESWGYMVIRFTNKAVLESLPGVLLSINSRLEGYDSTLYMRPVRKGIPRKFPTGYISNM